MIHGSIHQLRKLNILVIMLSPLFVTAIGCSPDTVLDTTENDNTVYKNAPFVTISTPKWYEGHTAAISITYDGGWDTGGSKEDLRKIQNDVLSRGLVMDYEVVTSIYEPWKTSQAELRNEMSLGFHFFGHGHFHVAHDSLTWADCINSFSTCFNLMKKWGLKPRAYAYPEGSGRSPITQDALSKSGFICARNYERKSENCYICPGNVKEPANWYFLPSLPMAKNINCKVVINTHDEMSLYIEQALRKTAWIIPCYHAVGIPNDWGFYPLDEFEKDIDLISARDFWCSNMDVIACYIKERNDIKIETEKVLWNATGEVEKFEIKFNDGLQDDVYDVPITVDIDFNTGYPVTAVHFNPPLNGTKYSLVSNNRLRVNVIPDNKPYQVELLK